MSENINQIEMIPCNNPSGIVCFDTETTDINPEFGEILQVSFVDGEGNVLLNSLVKPIRAKSWPSAQEVNKISPRKVKDAPTLSELAPKIKGILDSADTLVAYNIKFDLSFLRAANLGFEYYIHPKTKVDVMIDYAEVVGEWNSYYGNYKWKKLIDCANHYNFDWSSTGTHAHDSLGDALATLYCYPLVKHDLEEKREKARLEQIELGKKEIQRLKNNENYLKDNEPYFNKVFIEDFRNIIEARLMNLGDVNIPCNYIKPLNLLILSIFGGWVALDRFYLLYKTIKSGVGIKPSVQITIALFKILLFYLSFKAKFFIFIFAFMYLWDIVFAFKHAKLKNEQILVAYTNTYVVNLNNYSGRW